MRNHRAGAAGGTLEFFSEATKRDISRQLPLTIFLERTFGDILGYPRLDRPIVHPFFGGRKRTFARLRHSPQGYATVGDSGDGSLIAGGTTGGGMASTGHWAWARQ